MEEEEDEEITNITDEIDDDSDNSAIWPLPKWPELASARVDNERRHRALRRAKRRKAAQKEEKVTRFIAASETWVWKPPLELEVDKELPDDMKNRGTWNNSTEFIMSLISMSVGLGNFYRFPFVAYQNGGGAFLLPYILVLTFIGRPIYFMELALGQFCSFGQVKVWEMSPFFKGVGYGSALVSFVVVTYYSSVMGVTLFYFFNSFRVELPWSVCDPEWAGEETCQWMNESRGNQSVDFQGVVNLPQLYFAKKVMNEVDGIENGIGTPVPIPTLCLFLSWVFIFLTIVKGVQSTGKVAYFTTLYPYLVIFLMLIVACTKDGAAAGMLYFLKPDWNRITDPKVWFAATGQCFFSLGIGFGVISNYASYNPFRHPVYRDALIVSFADTLASFMAGLTVFGTLGTISLRLKKPINEVLDCGPGLVFVSFSDAIANTAYVPQLLSILFFSMLLALAVGSAVSWQMAAVSVIADRFPKLSQLMITTVMCILGFLISLIYVTPGGQFMLTLVDYFGGSMNIYILTTLECVAVAYVYGLNNFCRDIGFMLNMEVGWYWRICWGSVVPVVLTIVMIYTFVTSKRLEHSGHPFPDSAIICGWTLTVVSLIGIPILAVYTMSKYPGSLKERFLNSLKPSEAYGPRRQGDRAKWELFKEGIIASGSQAPSLDPEEQSIDNITNMT